MITCSARWHTHSLSRSAKVHEVQTFARLPSVPGMGQIGALVILSELHDLQRCPRVQDFVSSCRLVKCAKESNNKRLGTSGQKIGTVHLRWAFAEAAVLFSRQSQPGREYCTKLEHRHGKATALPVLAHKLGRTVASMRTREQAFALTRFVIASPRRGELEPTASLVPPGPSLLQTSSLIDSPDCEGVVGPHSRRR